jgi:alpha-glucuronidase
MVLFYYSLQAEDGYRLWLRYDVITDKQLLAQYRNTLSDIRVLGNSPTLNTAGEELKNAMEGLLGKSKLFQKAIQEGSVVIGTIPTLPLLASLISIKQKEKMGTEGFGILSTESSGKNIILITANSDVGVLYGVFHFLRLLQTHQNIQRLSLVHAPKIKLQI